MKRSILSVLAVLSLTACASSSTPQTTKASALDGVTVDQEMALRRAMVAADDWNLSIPERVAAACPGAQPPPTTPDWAENKGELRWALRRLAECYRDGALRGEDVTITATASPGHRSVAMVRGRLFADVLTSFGVSEERIAIKTGDATGYSAHACNIALRDGSPRGDRTDEKHADRTAQPVVLQAALDPAHR